MSLCFLLYYFISLHVFSLYAHDINKEGLLVFFFKFDDDQVSEASISFDFFIKMLRF